MQKMCAMTVIVSLNLAPNCNQIYCELKAQIIQVRSSHIYVD